MAKYIIISGGVLSGSGKGCCAASLAFLLKSRSHSVTLIKFDPYHSMAGTLSPSEHGETFVLEDGTECDLDAGHYQRLAYVNMTKNNICTSGILYRSLLDDHDNGKYLGKTVCTNPHFTDKIIERLELLGENNSIVIAEIGGTIDDTESYPYFEACRQLKQKYKDDVLFIHVAPVLWVPTIEEYKTKPLQNSIKELRSHGIQPDILLCRFFQKEFNNDITKILDKVSQITGIPRDDIYEALDVDTIYKVPIEFYKKHIDDNVSEKLRLRRKGCQIHKFQEIVDKFDTNLETINIGIVGKYDNYKEAYLSIRESLIHASLSCNHKVDVKFIKSDELEKDVDISSFFKDLHGIIVPGGFDKRGVEGKINAIRYARENNLPFLGICLGLQCAVIEFSRNVCGIKDANSQEFAKNVPYVINYVEGQEGLVKKNGTLRLGAYDCELIKGNKTYELYGKKVVSERHRHRYEVNSEYVKELEKNGLKVSGLNPQSGLVEIMELENHPYFIGSQFHPEFKSSLMSPSPLFVGLIKASIQNKQK